MPRRTHTSYASHLLLTAFFARTRLFGSNKRIRVKGKIAVWVTKGSIGFKSLFGSNRVQIESKA